jgi:Raf kinase inhibitor-like YbhB/YbcL family protein
MRLRSSAFEENQYLPAEYSRDGKNINPPLIISEVPAQTQSLALIVNDLDSFMDTRVHWLLFNIDPAITEIGAGSSPHGAIAGLTSSGLTAYDGPFPPTGVHRYVFKLYALDQMLKLPLGINKEKLEIAMRGHVLAQSQLIGLFKRK